MNAADSTGLKCEDYDDDVVSESMKYLEEVYIIQNYVADYVNHRVHLYDGHYPQLPEIPVHNDFRFELIRTVALIFEEKHAEELRDMVTTLCQRGRLSFQRYVEVVECFACNDDEPNAKLSYGRLVALISFAGLVATRLCAMNMFSEVSMITLYTSKFLQKRIALTWSQDGRSWENFFDLAKMIIKKNVVEEKGQSTAKPCCSRWWPSISALAIFGLLGIGAFTLMKTVLSAR